MLQAAYFGVDYASFKFDEGLGHIMVHIFRKVLHMLVLDYIGQVFLMKTQTLCIC